MSKLRSVNTQFWSDPYIEELTPSEKLLYLYFITNEKTNMLGVYELSIKKISFETGLNKDVIEKSLKSFESIGKMRYTQNHVVLLNFAKHQNYNTNMKKSAIDTYNALPKELKFNDEAIGRDNPSEGFERVLKALGMVRKIEVEIEDEVEIEKEDEKKDNIEERKLKFAALVKGFEPDFEIQMLREFYMYWSEHSPQGSKMRYEKEKVFDVKRRLANWARNSKKFDPPKEEIDPRVKHVQEQILKYSK